MKKYQEERMLIVTKTYPVPSMSYREISCVAAINANGEMRRLHPIPHRLMKDESQFQRWEWIKARVTKAIGDNRPESYHVDLDSIVRISKIDTSQGWAERLGWVDPHIVEGFKTLEILRQSTGKTLGFIRPIKFSLSILKSDDEWAEVEKTALSKDSLLDPEKVRERTPLRKMPYSFYYTFECADALGTQYRHKINDWEICQLYWNCENRYGANWEKPFRQKIEVEFAEKDLILMMGTMHRFPDKWLIIGVVYPPKTLVRPMELFQYVPDV